MQTEINDSNIFDLTLQHASLSESSKYSYQEKIYALLEAAASIAQNEAIDGDKFAMSFLDEAFGEVFYETSNSLEFDYNIKD